MFKLGSLSTATLTNKALFIVCLKKIKSLLSERDFLVFLGENEIPHTIENNSINIDNINMIDDEDIDYLVFEVFTDKLNELSPPFVYFGSHIGADNDFGFWVDDEAIQDLYNENGVTHFGANLYYLIAKEDHNCFLIGSLHGDDFIAQLCFTLENNEKMFFDKKFALWQI